ncbi:hypothetical protein [Tenacibaculum sp. IB213877]|uniref:hypothetical protein n=1 Tax=Tenacibaculum sp. IB213877 TaxID=3097351 RepID=UPI002A59A7EE|nr:hypothetical protein [Tenacibaculum sp. IB213877]MDY0781635.1 hypothetical protein [Tenacibaculum sp. IB213877]
MPKDIKQLLDSFQEEEVTLSANHQQKFKQKLLAEVAPKKKSFTWLYVAASIVVLIGLGITFYPQQDLPVTDENAVEIISLGSISPELKTIESYYMNTINYEISQLPYNKENEELVKGYLLKIGELTKEYKSLTQELNNKGVNDQTIDALINNLQLRLQLLQRLKKQLHNLKNKEQNENTVV